MRYSINLLPQEKKDFKRQSLLRRLKIGMSVGLLLYILVVGGLFTFSFLYSSQEKTIKGEISQLESQIKNFEKRESLITALKERAKAIDEVLKGSVRIPELLSRTEELTLPGVVFQTMEVASGQLDWEGAAQNVLVFGDFLDQFHKEETASLWSSLNLESLNRNKDGSYFFSLEGKPIF